MRRRHPLDFAADHALMTWQHAERRATARGLQPGDFVQDGPGGDVREVVQVESAGLLLDWQAHTEIRKSHRGSAAGRCAMYGGSAKGE